MANEAKQFTIGGVTHDVMDVGARQLIAQLQAAIDAITSGDTTTAIKTFQEVIDFLDGVTDDATLIGKLNELRTLINAKYSKPASGIPASDLADGVIPDVSGFATKTEVNAKANDNAVVKSISVNGTAQTKDGNGNVNIEVEGGGLSKEDISVETQGDGTVDFNVKDDTYTINLNHTHENMAKLVVCEESDLPSTLDNSTIYAITDSGETEIEKLIIRGMEFAGGGVPDTGEPMISSPSNGSTINLGTNEGSGVSKTITVKGKNLTGDLTVTVGTGLTISYGQSTGQSSVTIPMAQALLGAQVTIAYSGSGALDDGSLVISHGGSVLSSVVVVVVVVEYWPAGYTKLSSISEITKFITTNINAQGTTWRIDASGGAQTNQTEILVSYGDPGTLPAGTCAIGTKTGYWGLGGGIVTTTPKSERATIIVSFTPSGASMTVNNETINRSGSDLSNGPLTILGAEFPGAANYLIKGSIYSIKCTAGGSFDGVPAKRMSDDKEGIYDLANDAFYPLK